MTKKAFFSTYMSGTGVWALNSLLNLFFLVQLFFFYHISNFEGAAIMKEYATVLLDVNIDFLK